MENTKETEETFNPNITPEGNFTLTYFPTDQDAKPHTPFEEAVQYLYDCWNYEEVYSPWTCKTKKQLLSIINKVLLPACEEGNQDAIFWLFFAYFYGLGVERDDEKALEYYKTLAEYGYPNMQCGLGTHYCDINEGKMNRKAVRWFAKAAKQGNVEAMYRLGECYADLYGVRNNDRKAFLWFKRAANRGHEEAMWNVGLFYQRGIGVKKNLDLAAEWYDKAGRHDKAKRLRNGEDEFAEDENGFSLYQPWVESDDSFLSYPQLNSRSQKILQFKFE